VRSQNTSPIRAAAPAQAGAVELAHLIATIAGFALIAAGVVGRLAPGADPRRILTWMLGCLVAFELVVLPLAFLPDWLLRPRPPKTLARPVQPAATAWRQPSRHPRTAAPQRGPPSCSALP
jgi:hypothetical protein